VNESPAGVPGSTTELSGLRIAMLGVDGIGKTSLSRELCAWLARQGIASQVVSWRRLIAGEAPCPAPYPRTTLEQMWVEDWRLLYGGGLVDGEPVDQRLPRAFDEFQEAGVEERFPLVADNVRSSGPLASGLAEWAVDFVIEAETVRPLAAEGVVTIRESFGFKPVLKSLLIARACAPGSVPSAVVDRVIDRIEECYSDPYLQPDVGIFLDGDVEVAYERRQKEGRGVGIAEDLGLAGITGETAYLELQRLCSDHFAKVAKQWGWYRLELGDRTPADLCEEIVDEVLLPRARGGR